MTIEPEPEFGFPLLLIVAIIATGAMLVWLISLL